MTLTHSLPLITIEELRTQLASVFECSTEEVPSDPSKLIGWLEEADKQGGVRIAWQTLPASIKTLC